MGFLKVEHAKQSDHPKVTAAVRHVFTAGVKTITEMVGLHPASASLALLQAGVSCFASYAPRETAKVLRIIADTIEAEYADDAARMEAANREFRQAGERMMQVSLAAIEAEQETKQ